MILLSYEDFYEQLWDYISPQIVSRYYYEDNLECMRSISKDMFDFYQAEEGKIPPKYYSRIIESIFHNINSHKSTQEIDYNKF